MKTRLNHLLSALLVLSGPCGTAMAQVIVDRSIELNGTTDGERQVHGLSDPTSTADAMNARTLQAGQYRYAEVSGSQAWSAVLTPAPGPLQIGAMLVLHSQNANNGPVTLSVNGQGPYPVHVGNGQDLEVGDVLAGAMVTVVYDGSGFQLTSGRAPTVRPCPSGFVAVNEQYCIEVDQHDTMSFDSAAVLCATLNGRLCTWGEWYAACFNASSLGLANMVGDYEWSNNGGNADNYVRVVGRFSCNTGAVGSAYTAPARNVRCCARR